MCWFNAGPSSATLAQHWTNTWTMSRVCWDSVPYHTPYLIRWDISADPLLVYPHTKTDSITNHPRDSLILPQIAFTILSCTNKQQWLLTFQVSIYCCLSLHGRIVQCNEFRVSICAVTTSLRGQSATDTDIRQWLSNLNKTHPLSRGDCTWKDAFKAVVQWCANYAKWRLHIAERTIVRKRLKTMKFIVHFTKSLLYLLFLLY